MTAAQPAKKLYTFEEYLDLEQATGMRYEYWDGEVFAMAGTTKRHNTLVQSLARMLYPYARKTGCQVYAESVRQKLNTGDRYVYPDVIYTCDPDDTANDLGIILNSPSLLIEVISTSSKKTDIVDKRPHYTKLSSLLYYVLVWQTTYCVEVFERNVDFWKYRLIEGIDASVDLAQLDMMLPMKEIYEGVTLKLS